MPSSLFFNGRVISVPGAYSTVDASGLETAGLGASGIVAVLGTAEGGVPVTAMVEPGDIPRFDSAEKMAAVYRKGQLREVGNFLFAPMKDPDILAGAQQVLAMKTNPATQSTASLVASGLPQIDLTSVDYGAHTAGINVEVQDGSSQGKMLTIRLEEVVETVDNLGGDALGTLQYDGGTYGYDTALVSVNDAGDITVSATRIAPGASADVSNPVTNATVEIIGSNQTGTVSSLSAPSGAGVQTASGLSGITAAHVGRSFTISSSGSAGNNGTFVILTQSGGTSVTYSNPAGVAEGSVATWTVSDAGIKATLYGLSGALPVKEVVVHAGTTVAPGAITWDAGGLLGVILDKTPVAGSVIVRIVSAGATVFTIPVGSISKGCTPCQYAYVNNTTVSTVLSAAGAHTVLLFGSDNAGVPVKEKFTTNGTTPVVSVGKYAQIEAIVVGTFTGKTLTLTAEAAKTLATVQTTISKVADYFATKQKIISSTVTKGFKFAITTGQLKYPVSSFDVKSGVSVAYPATASLTGDLAAIVSWINQNSQLVTAKASVGSLTVPDNTTAPVFLSGGIEGIATFVHYQTALNLLKKVRVNTIVDLSGDPAVAAALDAHCAYMGGIGRSERDGTVGILSDDGLNVPTKTKVKAAIVDLNTRHLRAFAQAVTRYNTEGEAQEFLPPFLGAIAAGAQAGSPVGTSLTFKYANLLAFRQHSSWNPTDDAEEMIQSGLCFLETKEGVGRRFVRNITTHLSTNNIAFTEASVNNAVNFAAFNFRTAMEFAVGKRGFAGTLSAAKGMAVNTLGLLVDNDVITSYDKLKLNLVVDVMEVSVEMAPIIPVNFVPITIHLTTIAQAA